MWPPPIVEQEETVVYCGNRMRLTYGIDVANNDEIVVK